MPKTNFQVYAAAVTIGLIAGMRSMLAPRIASSIGAFPHPVAKIATTILAGGEIIADKLPFTPDRTSTGPLAGRLISGAVCGAAICSAHHRSKIVGALLGAAGAWASTFAAYEIRKRVTASRYIPGTVVALLEDGIALGSSRLLTNSFSLAKS